MPVATPAAAPADLNSLEQQDQELNASIIDLKAELQRAEKRRAVVQQILSALRKAQVQSETGAGDARKQAAVAGAALEGARAAYAKQQEDFGPELVQDMDLVRKRLQERAAPIAAANAAIAQAKGQTLPPLEEGLGKASAEAKRAEAALNEKLAELAGLAKKMEEAQGRVTALLRDLESATDDKNIRKRSLMMLRLEDELAQLDALRTQRPSEIQKAIGERRAELARLQQRGADVADQLQQERDKLAKHEAALAAALKARDLELAELARGNPSPAEAPAPGERPPPAQT